MKKCTKCGVEKDESEFYKDKNKKDTLSSWCKICSNENVKKWTKLNPEKSKKIKNKHTKTESFKQKRLSYSKTEKYKEYHRVYSKSDTQKEYHRKKQLEYTKTEKGKKARSEYFKTDSYYLKRIKYTLKKQIGETPPPELVEVNLLIYKTRKLCKTSKNLETI